MATQTQMTPAQQNYMARSNLIQTGLHMTKQLPPVTAAALGGTMQIPLQRMGIMTGVMLQITVPVTIGTHVPTVSPFAPYNFVQNITYTDYSGLQRVNTSGYQLHALNSFRGGRLMNQANLNMAGVSGWLPTTSETGVDTNILAVPTAVASANMTFSLYVPIAYDASSDLRGAVLSQTIYGDHYITIQLPTLLQGTDPLVYPYQVNTSSTVALESASNITVQAFQHYIMPQNGVANLPMIDLSTIYAVEGNYTFNSNISAGAQTFIPWPNNRSIMSAMHIVDQAATGGTANGTDVSQIILLGNSNTNIREMNPAYLRNQMRYRLGSDLPSGVYMLSSRAQPITTQLYGNVQTVFAMATAGAGTYISSQYESTYMSGTPLPGVVQ